MTGNEERFRIIYLLICRRKLIIKNVLFYAIVSSIILILFVPNWYKSTVQMIVSDDSPIGLGGIMAQIPFSDMLAPGMSTTKIDMIAGIFESRQVKDHMIENFKIDSIYEFDGKYYEDLLVQFEDNLDIEIEYEQSILAFSIYDKNPEFAAQIVNYYVDHVDSIMNDLFTGKARENKIFLEDRIEDVEDNLSAYNQEMKRFQKTNHVISIPDQIAAFVNNLETLNAELFQKEIYVDLQENFYGNKSNEYMSSLYAMNATRNKIEELIGTKESEYKNFITMNEYPELAIKYFDIFRKLTYQEKILEFLYPQYEHSKLEEQKNLSNVIILDRGQVAQRKSYPRRSIYVLAIAFIIFITTVFWIVLVDRINLIKENDRSLLLDSISILAKDLKRIQSIFKRK